MKKIPLPYYQNENVVEVARDLIGKILVTNKRGIRTAGIITETEAYNGELDKASHAYGGRRTSRTEIMYANGGLAYVYLCYGIHSLFNVVTNKMNIPHAILIRAIFPTEGIKHMNKRRSVPQIGIEKLCIGPGNVTKALGIHYTDTGKSLVGDEIWLEESAIKIPSGKITAGPRIGVGYAGKDALLPYRFLISHELAGSYI